MLSGECRDGAVFNVDPFWVYIIISQNLGYLLGGSYNEEYSILGSILGSPYFGKLPYRGYIRVIGIL